MSRSRASFSIALRLRGTPTGGVAAVSLTSMAVPTVRETPELSHCLLVGVMLVASARTREVLPTTRVRAAVPVVMAVSTWNSNRPLERRISRVTA